jgi:hypothetical protein
MTRTRTIFFLAALQLAACAATDETTLRADGPIDDAELQSSETLSDSDTEYTSSGAGDDGLLNPSVQPGPGDEDGDFDEEPDQDLEEVDEEAEEVDEETEEEGSAMAGIGDGIGDSDPSEACNENELRVQGPDGLPLATFSRFVFQDDGESVWMYGFEDIDDADACDWAASPADAAGYVISIEVTGDITAGAEKAWMDDDDEDDAAEVRIENSGTDEAVEAENDSGALIVVGYSAGSSLRLTGFNGSFDDGSFVVDGDIRACYCGSALVE